MLRHTTPSKFYKVPAWGGGFFDIDAQGQAVILLGEAPHQTKIPLTAIAEKAKKEGLSLPLLVRFPHVLRARVRALCSAFEQAKNEHHYQGQYHPVYPIKVNQQKDVVQQLLAADESVGLEAGSKPELLAALGLMEKNPHRFIICNGYKDENFIRLAFLGQQMGHRVVIVIEKFSELPIILSQIKAQNLLPILGLRVRLASIGKGNWQNTGGEKSKFGLSAKEVLEVVHLLTEQQLLPCLQLLHCHFGSQISDIEDLQKGLAECARFYVELKTLGAPLEWVDVGGGLGIDYEGNADHGHYSLNYSLLEYAKSIVHAFASVCSTRGEPYPHIITEAGRAMAAHHAVLITQVTHCEQTFLAGTPTKSSHPVFQTLHLAYKALSPVTAKEVFHLAKHTLTETLSLYVHGGLSLPDRAAIEQLVYQCYYKIYQISYASLSSEPPDFLHELTEKLAHKLVCNFSVFQSVPDVWGIDQPFPVLPLAGLQEELLWPTVIQDITCDSDGRMDTYVSQNTCAVTLPMPISCSERPFLIGIFLVGAYQEILGDMHNLFGRTDGVQVVQDAKEGFALVSPLQGDTIASVLQSVQISPTIALEAIRQKLAKSTLDAKHQTHAVHWVNSLLLGSTYLT